jgi:signal transduction histidine kinase
VRTGEIGIYSVDNGVEYQFIVQDNGRGISPADCEKIFEIFHRAGNQNLPGEGMGLAFVKTLLRQLSGRVWCESTLGAGTKINFTVPKRQA